MAVKLTSIFRQNAEALRNALNGTGPRLILNQGGQGSSKTYSILQVIYNILYGWPDPLKTTFASYALPHLKQGVVSDFDGILTSFGENLAEIKSSPQQPVYTIGKSIINCYGIEGNIALAHGPRRKLLYINEVNRKITYEVFDQLFSRSEITIVDFNPDAEFWLHDKVLPHFPHVLIKSNFLDNPYLPPSELQNILMKKDKPEFANWWKVYGLGELGSFEGSVFKNWRYEEPGEVERAFTELSYGFGMDYGFHPDPDAMSKNAIDFKRKKIYVKELIYTTNNATSSLVKQLEEHVKKEELIIAESATPRTNADLREKGFSIRTVVKTRTVAEWLKEMNDYEIIISEGSFNLAKELQNYVWADKKSGTPVDAWNHLIDEIRYYYMMINQPQGGEILGIETF